MAGPSVARVSLYGVNYEVDLVACRVRLAERAAQLGVGPGRSAVSVIAKAASVHPMSVYRFFDCKRPLSAESFLAVLVRGLALELRAVAKPIAREEAA